MAQNQRKIRERLQREVYDHIPSIHCKMMCSAACSIIPASVVEVNALEREAGHPLEVKDGLVCSMLGNDGACMVYQLRPAICRLYGVAEGMECPHGCTPERVLPRPEAMRLLALADRIGGVNETVRRNMLDSLRTLNAVLDIQAAHRPPKV